VVSAVKPVAILSVRDERAAGLRILGLSVLERNVRQLERAGFDVRVEHGNGDGGGAYVSLRGDFQYPNAFFRELKEKPVRERASGSDVAELLKNGADAAVAVLEKSFFDEILAGTGGVIARAINKKISFRLTRILVRTRLTPNAVTIINFLIGVAGCLLLVSPSWLTRVFGATLVQANSVIDGCDGEMAALKVVSSRLGAWLDTIADDVLNNLMLICLCFGLYRESHDPRFLRVSVATVTASVGVSFFIYHYLIAHGTQNAAHYRLSWDKGAGGSGGKSWFDVVKVLLKRDCFIFIGFALILLDLRYVLVGLFLPVWGAFFLYLASFLYGMRSPACPAVPDESNRVR
jgi:phosphatidylglycerophosphate synthase